MDFKKAGTDVAVALSISGLTSFGIWIRKWFKKQQAIKDSLLAQQHHTIIDMCTRMLERGSSTIVELEDLDFMMPPYENLGGNGTAHILYKKVKELPINNDFEPPSVRGSYPIEIHQRYQKEA